MANLDDKANHMAHSEDVESGRLSKDHFQQRRESVKHGDRALAIVGEGRIELTEEDVSIESHIAHSTEANHACRIKEFDAKPTESSWLFLFGFIFSRSWTRRFWVMELSSAFKRTLISRVISILWLDPSPLSLSLHGSLSPPS